MIHFVKIKQELDIRPNNKQATQPEQRAGFKRKSDYLLKYYTKKGDAPVKVIHIQCG